MATPWSASSVTSWDVPWVIPWATTKYAMTFSGACAMVHPMVDLMGLTRRSDVPLGSPRDVPRPLDIPWHMPCPFMGYLMGQAAGESYLMVYIVEHHKQQPIEDLGFMARSMEKSVIPLGVLWKFPLYTPWATSWARWPHPGSHRTPHGAFFGVFRGMSNGTFFPVVAPHGIHHSVLHYVYHGVLKYRASYCALHMHDKTNAPMVYLIGFQGCPP